MFTQRGREARKLEFHALSLINKKSAVGDKKCLASVKFLKNF